MSLGLLGSPEQEFPEIAPQSALESPLRNRDALRSAPESALKSQKNPRVRKIRVRNSGAGNGSANFMDAWKKCVLFCRKNPVHKIPRFRGGVFWVLGGGGKCRFYFYVRADFSERVLFLFSPRERESTILSTLGSTAESIPISESSPEGSTFGELRTRHVTLRCPSSPPPFHAPLRTPPPSARETSTIVHANIT